MSSRPQSEFLIKSFLNDGLDELPERSYDAVRTAIDHKRQWAVVGPWKEPQIMTATRFALIAAAIAVMAVLAVKFIPTGGGFGQAAPTPSPSPVASSASLPVTSGGPVAIPAGTYAAGNPFLVPLTVTIPDGWEANVGGPYAVFLQKSYGPGNISFTLQQSLYADPCHLSAGFLKASPGPNPNDLASALAAMPHLTAAGPAQTSIGGYSAQEVTLKAPTDTTGCDLAPGGVFRIWQLPLGGTEDLYPGATDHLWVIQVGDQRLVIQVGEGATESASDKAEADAIVNSISVKH